MIRVTPHEPDSVLTAGQVAAALGVSRRTVHRIPRARLDYWETPGGEHRAQRRYAFATVAEYAASLGVALEPLA